MTAQGRRTICAPFPPGRWRRWSSLRRLRATSSIWAFRIVARRGGPTESIESWIPWSREFAHLHETFPRTRRLPRSSYRRCSRSLWRCPCWRPMTLPLSPFRPPKLEPATAARVLALNRERLSADDVRTLGAVPAPRIMLIHGGIFPVHLADGRRSAASSSAWAIRRRASATPASATGRYSPYMDTKQLAGLVAWQYERDGMRPMMIGHSQGGMQVVKILHDLAGRSGDTLQVWNPRTWECEDRTSIVDPFTGKAQPVVGLTRGVRLRRRRGRLSPCLLPNQWDLPRHACARSRIPSTSSRASSIEARPGRADRSRRPLDTRYEANGKASVRNVTLPADLQPRHSAGGRRSAAGSRGARMDRGLRSGSARRHVGAVAVGATSRALRRRRLVQREEALVPRGEASSATATDARDAGRARRATRRAARPPPSSAQRASRPGCEQRPRSCTRGAGVARVNGGFAASSSRPTAAPWKCPPRSQERLRSSPAPRAASAAPSRASSPPAAATSPSTTTTAPTRPRRLCAEIRALGPPRHRDPGQRRHSRQRRRDVRGVRQALRPARHPGQQRRVAAC